MAFLELDHVSVGYGTTTHRHEVLADCCLQVQENEFGTVTYDQSSGWGVPI